jgi:hypothetical protein
LGYFGEGWLSPPKDLAGFKAGQVLQLVYLGTLVKCKPFEKIGKME